MTREEAISYLEAQHRSAARPGLERIRALLAALGEPQKTLRYIHVAGSNGKGSTCAMLDSILRKAGHRVGLYTSPHIEDFCERIRVDGQSISGSELASVTERVRAAADAMADRPGQFELVTAAAMVYFHERNCDIVVLEVGMGGALDSTNIIGAPEAAVITNIGLEHTEYLGDTLTKIASAKAGIIKPGCACVLYDSVPEVRQAVEAVCREKGVSLTVADGSAAKILAYGLDGQRFSYGGAAYEIPLLGPHQVRNAVVVLETVAVLRARGWQIDESAVRSGLREVKWPARMEILCREPLFILDGGHNPQCAQALADGLRALLPEKKAVFLTGVLADKDYPTMMETVLPLAREFLCLTPDSGRALGADALAEHLKGRGARADVCADVEDGIRRALDDAGEDGAAVAFGSLYLAGDIRSSFSSAYRRWLRRAKRRARESLPADERASYSAKIVERILAAPAFQKAKTVMLYKALPGEVQLDALEHAPQAKGKRFVYPRCAGEGVMTALRPLGEDAWRTGPFGIREPVLESSEPVAPEDIDLVVCPCTAFDEAGGRMGMGGGFYDRFLPQCVHAAVFAAAFEIQKVKMLPTEAWDVPMDVVFTEAAAYPPDASKQ